MSGRFPSLSNNAAKLVEIYCALSLDSITNDSGGDAANADFLKKYLHHIGRPVSTRYDIQCQCYRSVLSSIYEITVNSYMNYFMPSVTLSTHLKLEKCAVVSTCRPMPVECTCKFPRVRLGFHL